jgi:hypothetical protein
MSQYGIKWLLLLLLFALGLHLANKKEGMSR